MATDKAIAAADFFDSFEGVAQAVADEFAVVVV
jgi:hypothetical protein